MINIYDGQITDILSNTFRHNPETIAIAYAVLQEKRRILDLVERTRLMSAVDSLEERILDYLAVELRTPAYEDSLPLEVKRALIKGTLPFYSKLGTPAAVDWIINTIFGNGCIGEWFEYDGEPHHFRICVKLDHTVASLSKIERLVQAVYFAKRLTSWLDEIHITFVFPPAILHIGGTPGANVQIGLPQREDEFDFQSTLHAGGAGSIHASAGVHEARDKLSYWDRVYIPGGQFSAIEKFPVPESTAQPPATTILRTGGVCTIISNLSKGE